jgi:diguanylate cyclase (GGDEF)-like protein
MLACMKDRTAPKILIVTKTDTMFSDLSGTFFTITTQIDNIASCINEHPDCACILCDTDTLTTPMLLEFIRAIKGCYATYHIPLLIMAPTFAQNIMSSVIRAGADDYILKSEGIAPLIDRIHVNIQRSIHNHSTNPLTRLPGNEAIRTMVEERLGQPLALIYIDIDNFKAYNDLYGFARGDDVLMHTATLLRHTLTSMSAPDFIGHLGGDDFVILTIPNKATIIAEKIGMLFDTTIATFYTESNRIAQHIRIPDRKGIVREYPLMTLSIAIVTNEQRTLSSYAHSAQIAAELKRYAKTKPYGKYHSNIVKDRRRA